jgi:hypothetical protein
MNEGKTVFAQLMSFISDYQFNKCVARYGGNYKVRKFTCREHFYVLCFAQLTYRESLRDIEATLGALTEKLYRSGFKHAISRTTLAEANEKRDWRIYADFAQILIEDARELYRSDNEFVVELGKMAYALDSTTIDLCLTLFPWARFRKTKAAVKLHTLIDLRGSIPTFIEITDGLVHDVNILDKLNFEAGAFYIFDMGYISCHRLYKIHQNQSYFVTRAHKNMNFERVYSRGVDKNTGLRSDQSVRFKSFYPRKGYPELMRRVRYHDDESSTTYDFLTNNFELEAIKITQLYKERWKVELFFKWIKQNLRIKKFYGNSKNAVCCQVWIAICAYLLIAIVKKKLGLKQSLYTLLQIFSLSLFEKTPIKQLITNKECSNDKAPDDNQLKLFDL